MRRWRENGWPMEERRALVELENALSCLQVALRVVLIIQQTLNLVPVARSIASDVSAMHQCTYARHHTQYINSINITST